MANNARTLSNAAVSLSQMRGLASGSLGAWEFANMGEDSLSAANVIRSLIRKGSRRGGRDSKDRCVSF